MNVIPSSPVDKVKTTIDDLNDIGRADNMEQYVTALKAMKSEIKKTPGRSRR